MNTSHSEQTVVSITHGSHKAHESETVDLSTVQTSVELRNYNESSSSDQKHPSSNKEENRVWK
jgi:hypothetical protein